MTALARAGALAAPKFSRPVGIAALLALVAILLFSARDVVSTVGTDPARPDIVDFHPFYLAGRLALEGRLAEAYDVPRMAALLRSVFGGRDVSIPFVYPPTAGLLLAPLALLPVGPSFLVFGAATLAFFLAVLRWLAGPWFGIAALVAAPAMLIDLRIGQNGLLTGGLVGLSAGLALRGRGGPAGLACGLLAFKPHVATGLALLLLVRRDRAALAVALGVAAAAGVLALALFGVDTLAGFRGAMSHVGRFMAAGAVPLHRVASVYACALSFGAPASVALLLHGAVAVAVLASTAAAVARRPNRSAAGLCVMSTAFVSPYLFDYDLPAFCVGLALVLPDLAAVLAPSRLKALLAAVCFADAFGLLFNRLAEVVFVPSLASPVLLLCFCGAMAALRYGACPAPAALPAEPRP